MICKVKPQFDFNHENLFGKMWLPVIFDNISSVWIFVIWFEEKTEQILELQKCILFWW